MYTHTYLEHKRANGFIIKLAYIEILKAIIEQYSINIMLSFWKPGYSILLHSPSGKQSADSFGTSLPKVQIQDQLQALPPWPVDRDPEMQTTQPPVETKKEHWLNALIEFLVYSVNQRHMIDSCNR